MPFEIDYLPVDAGQRSGDAIAIRIGNLNGPREHQIVGVIDGGFTTHGESLVQHINDYYHTNRLDFVISTHPDMDHIAGLSVVLEKMEVGILMMHKPWEHASAIKDFFKNRSLSASGLEERIEKSMQQASALEDLALKKNIPIVEPFQGQEFYGGMIKVLGPSIEYYRVLLTQLEKCPEPIDIIKKLIGEGYLRKGDSKLIPDAPHLDLLCDDTDCTSAQNNTSTILLFNIGGQKILFTGDAGKSGLMQAISYAENRNTSLTDLSLFDVPHHGSKHNLTSKILSKVKAGIAVISASKESDDHPAKKVTNALLKHGMPTFVTRGRNLLHHHQGNLRGWGDAAGESFHNYVEE